MESQGIDISTEEGGKTAFARLTDVFVNMTKNYDTCFKPIIKSVGVPDIYFKYKQPQEPHSELVMEKAYKYDYQFDQKEIYAMTWT